MTYQSKVTLNQVSAKDALNDWIVRNEGYKNPHPKTYKYLKVMVVFGLAIIAVRVWQTNFKPAPVAVTPVAIPAEKSSGNGKLFIGNGQITEGYIPEQPKTLNIRGNVEGSTRREVAEYLRKDQTSYKKAHDITPKELQMELIEKEGK